MVQRVGDGLYDGAVVVLMIFSVSEIEYDLKHSAPDEVDAKQSSNFSQQQCFLSVTDFVMYLWNVPYIHCYYCYLQRSVS